MADEFAKGFGILSIAGLIWMILGGWFRTPSFGGPQFTGAPPQDPSTFETMGLILMDAMGYFAVLGALTFWVFIPVGRHLVDAYQTRRADRTAAN